MNRDQVKGRAKEAGGKIKEVAGRVVGDRSTEAKGMAKKIVGKVQKEVGDARERNERATRKPS